MPLPTRPQRYCDPVSLVFFFSNSQFFLMERNSVETIPAEVAMLMSLPMPVLERMDLELKLKQEEEERIIRRKMTDYKNALIEMLRTRRLFMGKEIVARKKTAVD